MQDYRLKSDSAVSVPKQETDDWIQNLIQHSQATLVHGAAHDEKVLEFKQVAASIYEKQASTDSLELEFQDQPNDDTKRQTIKQK